MSLVRAAPLSLSVQLLHLKKLFPEGEGRISRSRLSWIQTIRPDSLACTYTCQVEHTLGGYPEVHCLEPKLSALADGRQIPHVYRSTEPVSLCLFFRDRTAWHDGLILARMVVPLAYSWLAFFEDWLFSGEWRGGGTHPVLSSPPTVLPFGNA